MAYLWTDYEWIVIVGALLAFAMAWGIGANDVANAFGTSVGAKTLTLPQACCIAAVFEFVGAVALGGEVAKTISGGIARAAYFNNDPEVFAFGMMCALGAAATWVAIATYLSLAVSTTHSIIGAVLGFALVFGGTGAVVWNDKNYVTHYHMINGVKTAYLVNEFPYSKGLVPVVCSWFVSPTCSCIVSCLFFIAVRTLIMRRENATTIAIWSFPILVVFTVYVNLFLLLFKGARNELKWDKEKSAWVAACIAGGMLLIGMVAGIPYLRWRLRRDMTRQQEEADSKKVDIELVEEAEPTHWFYKALWKAKKAMLHGINQDIHATVDTDPKIAAMHAAAEVFDPETEQIFKYLQVFSACAVSFAHGSNDVANAIGPFAGIWYVYNNRKISTSAETPKWILALGGAGIVVGLATYGYNIIIALGVGMAKMTPSRGFCAELATSFVIVIASCYGLPVSSTQIIVGGEFGIGLCENIKKGPNYALLGKTILGWIFTIFIAGLLSACFFSMGVYAPSVTMGKELRKYELQLRTLSEGMYKDLNASNFALNKTFTDKAFDAYLNTTVYTKLKTTLPNMYNTKLTGNIEADLLMKEVNAALTTYKNYTTTVVGFNKSSKAYSAPGGPLSGTVALTAYTSAQIAKK